MCQFYIVCHFLGKSFSQLTCKRTLAKNNLLLRFIYFIMGSTFLELLVLQYVMLWIKYHIFRINRFICMCFDKSAFELLAVVFWTYSPCWNFMCFVVFGETLLPKCARRPWYHFRCLVKTWELHANYKSSLDLGGFSVFVLSLYIWTHFLITFGPQPTPCCPTRRP